MMTKESGRWWLLWRCSGFLVVSSLLVFVYGHVGPEDDDRVNPYDMLNYDPDTESMRNSAENDHCKLDYWDLIVKPMLLVPPGKVFEMTFKMFFVDPLVYLAKVINMFLRVLLEGLPVSLQISMFISILLCFLVFSYSMGQAVAHIMLV